MGLREKINQNSQMATIIVAAILVVAIGLMIYQFSGGGSSTPTPPDQMYYTVDDGASFFVDGAGKMPFSHEGKPAYRAYVFKTDSGKEFVGYIERISPRLDKMLSTGSDKVDKAALLANPGAYEVKAPGANNRWLNPATEAGHLVTVDIKTPDGSLKRTPVNP